MPAPPLPPPQHPLSPCRVRPVCARSPLLGLCRHLCPCLSLTQGEAHPGARQSVRGERPAGPGRGPCPRTPSGREAAGRPGGHSVSALSMPTPARTRASICGSVPQRLPSTSTPRSFPTGSPLPFSGEGGGTRRRVRGLGLPMGAVCCLASLLLPARSVDPSGRPAPRVCRGAAFRRQMSWRTGDRPSARKELAAQRPRLSGPSRHRPPHDFVGTRQASGLRDFSLSYTLTKGGQGGLRSLFPWPF